MIENHVPAANDCLVQRDRRNINYCVKFYFCTKSVMQGTSSFICKVRVLVYRTAWLSNPCILIFGAISAVTLLHHHIHTIMSIEAYIEDVLHKVRETIRTNPNVILKLVDSHSNYYNSLLYMITIQTRQ